MSKRPLPTTADVVVVGAGFAGLYMLHRLREQGLRVQVIEAGDDVGGTWYWNGYPGARCDVESLEYQYSFSDALQREWNWSERYARQPELLAYAQHVADRFGLRPHIALSTRVTSAHFDEVARRWIVETDQGDLIRSQFLIAATGCLSAPALPEIAGLDQFRGRILHTARWPKTEVNFKGRAVAVVGTGSSAIQAIPLIAQDAEQLFVLQRTPNFSIPAFNRPLSDEERQSHKAQFAELKARARGTHGGVVTHSNRVSALTVTDAARDHEYEMRWLRGGFHLLGAFSDIMTSEAANASLADFVRRKIRKLVKDPALAEALSPHDHPCGAKRICVDTDYYTTFNRSNVTLVDLRKTPLLGVSGDSLITRDGPIVVDDIVFATGFDAMTGPLLNIEIRGRGGRSLQEAWAEGPKTYLGLGVAGFPNLLIIAGPGSPSVLTNVLMSIEQHVDWIAELLGHMQARGFETVEAHPQAQATWVDTVNEAAAHTLFPKAGSWYLGANIPGKPRVFMPFCGGLGVYAALCRDVADKDYDGFTLQSARAPHIPWRTS